MTKVIAIRHHYSKQKGNDPTHSAQRRLDRSYQTGGQISLASPVALNHVSRNKTWSRTIRNKWVYEHHWSPGHQKVFQEFVPIRVANRLLVLHRLCVSISFVLFEDSIKYSIRSPKFTVLRNIEGSSRRVQISLYCTSCRQIRLPSVYATLLVPHISLELLQQICHFGGFHFFPVDDVVSPIFAIGLENFAPEVGCSPGVCRQRILYNNLPVSRCTTAKSRRGRGLRHFFNLTTRRAKEKRKILARMLHTKEKRKILGAHAPHDTSWNSRITRMRCFWVIPRSRKSIARVHGTARGTAIYTDARDPRWMLHM